MTVWTEGFDGKDWATRMFIEAPAPRTGLLGAAARGPDGLTYPWDSTFISNDAVYVANSSSSTADVGSRRAGASWVGALDMSGNVQ